MASLKRKAPTEPLPSSFRVSTRQEAHLSAVRRWLTLWYLCAILLAVTVLTTWFYNTTRVNLLNQLDSALKAHVDVVSREVYYSVQDPNNPQSPPSHINTTDSYTGDDSAHFTDYPVYVTNADLQVINVRGHDLAPHTAQPSAFVPPNQGALQTAFNQGGSALVHLKSRKGAFALSMTALSDGNDPPKVVGWIIAEGSLDGVEQQAQRLLIQLVLGSAALLLFSIGGGWMLAGLATRPIRTALEQQRQFIDDAAHQIGTPLTIIQARAELALQTDMEDEKTVTLGSGRHVLRNSLLEVIDESQRLHLLARELLTLARLDRGQLDIKQDLLALNEVLDEVYQQIRPLAITSGLEARLEVPPEVVTVCGDFERLCELILILVDNAIKYTPQGGKVTLALVNTGTQAQVQVRDSGLGIAPEDLPHIFERFYRIHSDKLTNIRGHGLGLAIARRLVEVHRGSLNAESGIGQGTTMTVTLPSVKL
jgi:signal transduction histidine kinase